MTIITTVGTSIFENYFKQHSDADTLKDDYQDRLKNRKDNLVDFNRWEEIKIKNKRLRLVKQVANWAKNNLNASAEITSILEIAKQTKDNKKIKIHLIATDTVLSVSAAEMIKSWFEERYASIKVEFEIPKNLVNQKDSNHIIHKLRVASNDDFQEGFMNLIEVVSKLIDENKKDNEATILNITGGYKAIVPIITLIGQIKEIPLNYIYEEYEADDKSQLVEIDKLPISFDWKLGELYLDDLSKDGLKQISKKPIILDLLRAKRKLIHKNHYKLTPLGKLFTSSLTGLQNSKKSTLGYLVELKVFEYFIKNGFNTIRGKSLWWEVNNRTKFSYKAKYNQNNKLEQKIDVDIAIKEDASETWMEVKVCSGTGLNKAKKQMETMLDFIKQTSYHKVKKIGLILYKLETTDLAFYSNQITFITKLFEYEAIAFTLQFINIPINKDGLFNTKRFFEQEIELEQYTINYKN